MVQARQAGEGAPEDAPSEHAHFFRSGLYGHQTSLLIHPETAMPSGHGSREVALHSSDDDQAW